MLVKMVTFCNKRFINVVVSVWRFVVKLLKNKKQIYNYFLNRVFNINSNILLTFQFVENFNRKHSKYQINNLFFNLKNNEKSNKYIP
jgi:hypothetical protein